MFNVECANQEPIKFNPSKEKMNSILSFLDEADAAATTAQHTASSASSTTMYNYDIMPTVDSTSSQMDTRRSVRQSHNYQQQPQQQQADILSSRKKKASESGNDSTTTKPRGDRGEQHKQVKASPSPAPRPPPTPQKVPNRTKSRRTKREKEEDEEDEDDSNGTAQDDGDDDEATNRTASYAAIEMNSTILSQRLENDEKKRTIMMLEKALQQQRELTIRHAQEADKEMQVRLEVQKNDYEATIQRHLSFIDQV